VRAVPWKGVHDQLPYHHDPTRQAPSTLLTHQEGTVADRRYHYVRVVSVLRSPQAQLGVMLSEPRLADVVPRALSKTEEAWTVPAGFTLPDPDDVPQSTAEESASAAYHARKRRHAGMERGGPAQPWPSDPGTQVFSPPGTPAETAAFPVPGASAHEPVPWGPEGEEEEARAWGLAGSSASPCGSAASTPAGSADWDQRPDARNYGAGPTHDGPWANEWRDDHSSVANDEFGSVTAGHLAPTLAEPDPSQSRGNKWMRDLGGRIRSGRSGPGLSRG